MGLSYIWGTLQVVIHAVHTKCPVGWYCYAFTDDYWRHERSSSLPEVTQGLTKQRFESTYLAPSLGSSVLNILLLPQQSEDNNNQAGLFLSAHSVPGTLPGMGVASPHPRCYLLVSLHPSLAFAGPQPLALAYLAGAHIFSRLLCQSLRTISPTAHGPEPESLQSLSAAPSAQCIGLPGLP